jgi:hypothetical protein
MSARSLIGGRMRQLPLTLLVACAFLFSSACSVPPPAQQTIFHGYSSRFEPGSQTNYFLCDAPAGKYSDLNSTIASTNARIKGFMQVSSLHTGSAWPPDAGVVFAGRSKLPRVGLETFVLPDKPETLQIAVRGAGGGGDHTVFASVPIPDSPIPFMLELDRSGHLSLSFGDASTSLSVGPIEMTRVNLYCSSALVRFTAVEVVWDE